MLSLQGAQVQSLVGELRSHMLHGVAKKKKNKNKLSVIFYLCNIFFFPFGHILEIMDQPLRCILEPNICPLKEEIQTSCFLIQNYEGKNIMRF